VKIERTTTKARQAVVPGVVPYVLAGSLALATLLGVGLFVYVIYFLR